MCLRYTWEKTQKTVEKVLLAYTDRVLADFPSYQTDGRVACILVNNTQQLRVQLEKVYETMARDRSAGYPPH